MPIIRFVVLYYYFHQHYHF